jgi:hypothetical protein
MDRSRDNQRHKVYSWENTDLKQLGHDLFTSVLTENECELFIVNAIRWWGRENLISKLPKPVEPLKYVTSKRFSTREYLKVEKQYRVHKTRLGGNVKVKFRNYEYGGKSWYDPSDNSIHLTRQWALNKGVCLHEAAHLLLNKNPKLCISNCAWHGAEFMRIYLMLLVRFTPFTMSQLTKSARKRRIKISGLTVKGYDIRPYNKFQKTA